MVYSSKVFVNEVSPRDGFQMESSWIETDAKVRYVDNLSALGFTKIEVSSFVSPSAVPQMRDADEVFKRIVRSPGITYAALVANVRGADRAIRANVDEINFVMSVSETHNNANVGMPCKSSLKKLQEVSRALEGTKVGLNASAAIAFDCPFEGPQPLEKVLAVVAALVSAGAGSITLADTIGTADPVRVENMVVEFFAAFPDVPLTMHFHDTRGLAMANVLCAYQKGVVRFDGSLGGIGGCPFAPGASGNICTEDMVYMFRSMNVPLTVDLSGMLSVVGQLGSLIGHELPSHLAKVKGSRLP
jgi:hydroxymethylglutaryl-CoA lyase